GLLHLPAGAGTHGRGSKLRFQHPARRTGAGGGGGEDWAALDRIGTAEGQRRPIERSRPSESLAASATVAERASVSPSGAFFHFWRIFPRRRRAAAADAMEERVLGGLAVRVLAGPDFQSGVLDRAGKGIGQGPGQPPAKPDLHRVQPRGGELAR